MIIRDSIEKLAVPNTRKLHGHTTVLYLDKWKNVVHRLDKDNDITASVNDIYKTMLLSNLGMNRIDSVWDFFGGCLICDQEVPYSSGSPAVPPTSLAAGIGITAHAGQRNRPSGDTNTKRGNPNNAESFNIAGGYRYVWDWGTSEGLGPVKAVCLTHKTNGFNGLLTPEILNGEFLNEFNGSTGLIGYDWASGDQYNLHNLFPVGNYFVCLDAANDCYYTVHYSGDGNFEINKYAYSMLNARLVKDHTLLSSHTATSSKTVWVEDAFSSCQLLGGYIYYTYIPNNGNKIYICKINTADFSDVTDTELTVPSATFTAPAGYSYNYSKYCIYDGYIYIPSGTSTENFRVYKVNLSDQTDVSELTIDEDLSFVTINSATAMVEINGLIWCMTAQQRNPYVIDTETETVYQAPRLSYSGDYANCYGAINVYNNLVQIWNDGLRTSALAPNFISTVNNLGASHDPHTSDTMMKVIYEITEV